MNEPNVTRGDEDPALWFKEHFDDAADQILAFLADAGLRIEDRLVADVGCGDGIIDLGLVTKGRPRKVVGYDLRATDVDALRRAAVAAGVLDELPDRLSFTVSEPDMVPAHDDAFDFVVTWSAFEHVSRPSRMLSEIRRILKPDGVAFLQVWPFFYSEHGGHLWPHYEEPFPHLLRSEAEIRDRLRGRRGTDASRDALDEYESLNRITLGDLQRALLAAGMVVTKLELLSSAVHIPHQLSHLPLEALGVGGVKLLAVPR